MEIELLDPAARSGMVSVKNALRRCPFHSGELCAAPAIRFKMCRQCYRIDPRFAVRNLFGRIKAAAYQLLRLQAKPPAPLPPGS